MKCLAIVATLLAVVVAEPFALFGHPSAYQYGAAPGFYSAGVPSYYGRYGAFPYSNYYAGVAPYSNGYSYVAGSNNFGYAAAPAAVVDVRSAVAVPAPVVAPAVVAPAAVPTAYAYQSYAPAFHSYGTSQYRSQDALGNYAYGYQGDTSAKHETRSADGVVTGGYSYLDANNLVQQVNYVSDAGGFRVAATNLPVAPVAAAPIAYAAAPIAYAAPVPAPIAYSAVPAAPATVAVAYEGPAHIPVAGVDVPEETPEVKAAKAAHFAAHAEALARTKRSAEPSRLSSYSHVSVHRPSHSYQHGQVHAAYPSRRHGYQHNSYRRVHKREADPEPAGVRSHYNSHRPAYAPIHRSGYVQHGHGHVARPSVHGYRRH